MAEKDAFSLAQETADKYKNEIIAELQGARITAETLSTVFETLKDHQLTDRTMMNDILKNALAKKEYITAFCVAYDPDALDGNDKNFAGKKTNNAEPDLYQDSNGFKPYDSTGRYAPYWNKLGSNIDVESLGAIDTENWYIIPKTELHEFITDPYEYGLQGKTVMLASFVFPITHKGKFIGIISPDIVLDKLQEMVSKVSPHGQGELTEILSNAGAIVAHPDKQYLAKDLSASLLLEMLTTNKATINAAVKLGEDYLAAHPAKPAADPNDEEQKKAADTETEKYEKGKQFVGKLRNFAPIFDRSQLDISLLSAELAESMLKADPKQSEYAAKAKEAIKTGQPYISAGKDFYTVYMPIQFSKVTNPWSVAVSIPMAKIHKTASRIRNYVADVSMIAIFVITVILYIISGNITRPILKLSDAAKILGEGNYDVVVPTIRNNDEIGTLTKTFKFMAEKISDQIKEMQQYAKTLEEKNVYLSHLNELKDDLMAAATAASEAKSLFLTNMSHELRTPLNAVIGLSSLMRLTNMNDEQRDCTEKIQHASATLLGIVNNILDFTEVDAGNMKLTQTPFDMRRVFDDITVFFKSPNAGAPTDVPLYFDLDESLPPSLIGDPLRLQRIFINLVDNAFKFTEKGSITVRAKAAKNDGKEVTIHFAVEDTGIGISEQKLDEIFAVFNQADNSATRKYGGVGIGLTVTREIVELMGGKINVASEVGKGTSFTFSCAFPIAGDTAAADTNAENTENNENGNKNEILKGLRVLLVEDNKINALVATRLLQAVGIEVTSAINGNVALEKLAEATKINPEKPFDLVLMDLQMPVMDGYEATKIIKGKDEYHNIPVFALTAHTLPEDRERCLALGMQDHLNKPIDIEIFYKTLREVAEKIKV
ncbi:hypothetical protein FACS189454_06260 [Planctomycetales bacterium]|nr:hypothetical protein FACS189454_06260 [Planctomycetales bacterium]